MDYQGPSYSIDQHPQKDIIVKRIIDGLPSRKVVSGIMPHLSHSTVQRYKTSVIKPIIARAEKTERILLCDQPEPETKKQPVSLVSNDSVRQTAVQAIKDAPVVSLFRAGLEKYRAVIDRTIDRAESAVRVATDKDGNEVVIGADLGVIAPLLNQAHKNLEILGRATGELEPQGAGQVSIQIVLPRNQTEEPRISFASRDAIEIQSAPDEDGGLIEIGVLQKG